MALEYSKEVKKNFTNPKNMGEIKNADGIGKVGNPTCLLPDQKILLNKLFTKIESSSKGDFVLSDNKTDNRIIEVFSRIHTGKVIQLKNSLGTINLTEEHLIQAINLPKGDKFKRNLGKRNLIPSWFHARDLKKGDISLYSFSQEEKDIKKIEIKLNKSNFDFRSKKLPKSIELNKDFLRLVGYFLSEGNIQDKPSKSYISFSLNIKETEIVEDIKRIVKKLFDLEVVVFKRPKNHSLVCYIYNAQLARWFKSLFNNGAQNKLLPEFIMTLPIEKQKDLIIGLWKGDGYINLNRNNPRAGYSTISYQLVQQLKILLLRQGIIPSIYIEKEKDSKGVHHKDSFRIHVGQSESLKKLANLMNKEYNAKSFSRISSWIRNGVLYTPITSIEKIKYSGKVYNLEVKNTHSFVSEAFNLHNCGDVMWMYIKVDKDKQGKEILKDIKFKTFGCAAAIATSSMMTQLAKGKPLEEAEKITRNDVAESLHGLPPVKMHCSNLASDALKKAIDDYRSKGKKKGEGKNGK